MRKKTKSTPKKASTKKSRPRKINSVRKKKVAVKSKTEDTMLGKIKTVFDDTTAKIKMFLPGENPPKESHPPKSTAE